jgi:Mg/Co/Ni transporter MgtE
VTELPDLTLAYLQQRPESAARSLEGMTAADAAEILRRVPSRISAPVVAAMSPVSAARCVTELPAGVAAALCAALSWSDTAALLRRLEARKRDTVLAELPGKMARRLRRSLDYADDVVGAWIELDAPTILDGRDVGEAVQLLARSPVQGGSHLLLTDAAQRYSGMVPLFALLKSAATMPLSALAQSDVQPLYDSASLASVTDAQGWELSTVLPVVNHRGVLLGGVSRRTLLKALGQASPATHAARVSLPAEMLKAYLRSGEGLLRLLMQRTTAESRGRAGSRR